MWNLCGDDIERAKEELKGRRAEIQARYDSEVKQLDTKIDELQAFERAAQAFVLDFKNAAVAAAAEPDPAPQAAPAEDHPPAATVAADDPSTEDEAAGQSEDAAPASETERGRGENRSSRWRMRLATTETSA